MARPRLIWTPDMVAALRDMRARGIAIYDCADMIGVCYRSAVYKCRELRIAGRMNYGAKRGEVMIAERQSA